MFQCICGLCNIGVGENFQLKLREILAKQAENNKLKSRDTNVTIRLAANIQACEILT